MKRHCTGVMPTTPAASDKPGFARRARAAQVLVVLDGDVEAAAATAQLCRKAGDTPISIIEAE